ncbi:MAG: outer membrane protein assembly factor BamD [Phycisphaeraceae bacterium]|nr:outer membrane protein assembly factor BamD [Phycisphaeraceae bacterium]
MFRSNDAMVGRSRSWPIRAFVLALAVFAMPGAWLAAAQAGVDSTRPVRDFDPGATEPWVQQQVAPPDSPEGRLQAVRKLLAEDQPRDAIRELGQWESVYSDHPLMAEARLLRGDAKVARGDYYGSLYDYEYVARRFPGTEQFEIALERLYEVGKLFLHGKLRSTWLVPFRIFPARSEAEEVMIRIQVRAPGSEIAERAAFTLAEYYFDRGRMRLAAEMYDIFLINFPRSEKRELAMRRLIQASLASFKGPRFDASGLIEARERLIAYESEFPAAAERLGVKALMVRIEESLALKLMDTAQWYERRGKDFSAVYLYERLVHEYPATAAARDAERRLERLRPSPPSAEPAERPATDNGAQPPENVERDAD